METPPILFTSILIGYLMMIEHGPKLMATRKPFELKTILLVYNFTQVVLNVALGVYVRSNNRLAGVSSLVALFCRRLGLY